jgi:hypothetical protein
MFFRDAGVLSQIFLPCADECSPLSYGNFNIQTFHFSSAQSIPPVESKILVQVDLNLALPYAHLVLSLWLLIRLAFNGKVEAYTRPW